MRCPTSNHPCVCVCQVFSEELFGQVAEEKEVEGITGSLFEAKKMKSCEAYGIVASLVSTEMLPNLVNPLKEVGSVYFLKGLW